MKQQTIISKKEQYDLSVMSKRKKLAGKQKYLTVISGEDSHRAGNLQLRRFDRTEHAREFARAMMDMAKTEGFKIEVQIFRIKCFEIISV